MTAGLLHGQVAIVTGGSTGIGSAIAQRLASEGATVASVSRRVRQSLAPGSKSIKAYACDVCRRDQTLALVDRVTSELGRLDILINNAGMTATDVVCARDEKVFREMIDVKAPVIVEPAEGPSLRASLVPLLILALAICAGFTTSERNLSGP